MLLKGQGLTVQRPPRTTGTAIGLGLCGVAVAIAAALVLRTYDWPASWPLFLAIVAVVALVALAAMFAFWAWRCYSLHYVIDRSGITIGYGLVRHFISIDDIEEMKHGRSEIGARVTGLVWPGHQVGRGEADDLGPAIFFSTHSSPEQLVYIKTPSITYAISPADPIRFMSEANRFREYGKAEDRPPVSWSVVGSHPVWTDRVAQLIALAAISLNLALWGFVFAFYPDLDNQITIEFPPVGDITTLQSRSEILRIPAVATSILVVNLLAGLVFQWRERAASYLLVGGAVVLQAACWIAAIVAIVNA